MAGAIQEARKYFGPEVEPWSDDEVVHRLMICFAGQFDVNAERGSERGE